MHTVVVGAGVAGLACARHLAAAGRGALVLDRSRGVGGRCATRRVDGQPVDHGVSFVHGSDPRFLAAARDVGPARILEGWPERVEGDGPPCLPRAFARGESRFAYGPGMSAFPKAMARGLPLRLEAPVASIVADGGKFVIRLRDGSEVIARDAVLALPTAATRSLLAPLAIGTREQAAVASVLEMVGTQACLTVIAGYPLGTPAPRWDVLYPGESDVVQTIVHDSAKRAERRSHVLVYQGRPCWSRLHLEDDPASWAGELLAEGARILGRWAAHPEFHQAHRWRFARTDPGTELTRPLTIHAAGGGRLVLTGESFAPGGGIEAAWLAGVASAARLLEEE